jgi:hypothetical protein
VRGRTRQFLEERVARAEERASLGGLVHGAVLAVDTHDGVDDVGRGGEAGVDELAAEALRQSAMGAVMVTSTTSSSVMRASRSR